MSNHPHRLRRDHYVGRRTHFLTACTYSRRSLFRDPRLCAAAHQQILRAASKHGFEDIANTFMPEHVHVLVQGVRDNSDFLKWLNLWRQLSGFWHHVHHQTPLWQKGYWDYTLRDDDSVMGIASYIVWNPVAAGIVSAPQDYPYTFSERFSIADIATFAAIKPKVGDL